MHSCSEKPISWLTVNGHIVIEAMCHCGGGFSGLLAREPKAWGGKLRVITPEAKRNRIIARLEKELAALREESECTLIVGEDPETMLQQWREQ